jgi:hypothetical protein
MRDAKAVVLREGMRWTPSGRAPPPREGVVHEQMRTASIRVLIEGNKTTYGVHKALDTRKIKAQLTRDNVYINCAAG